ncbi:MAG: hypothetical protein HY289_15520 [Planctomycetes bacterium]|nr:hypothetical protein [Planctomycetota bacterium]
MKTSSLFPFDDDAGRIERHCKLPMHVGTARIGGQDVNGPLEDALDKVNALYGGRAPHVPNVEFQASYILPATGNSLFILRNRDGVQLNRVFGQSLVLTGSGSDGPFQVSCPNFYIRAIGEHSVNPCWAAAEPVNCMVTIVYGSPRPVARVVAIINNFDFDHGNWPYDVDTWNTGDTLRVEAAGHHVDFDWRDSRKVLRDLLDIGVMDSTALVKFTFDAWADASETDLSEFAYRVASLCGVVVRQQTGVPVLSFLDEDGKPVKRLLGNVVESKFRDRYILRCLNSDNALPRLFRECFEEYGKVLKSPHWKGFSAQCAAIEDAPFLEQKCATLMAALHVLFRASLIESNIYTPEEAEKILLPGLIGAVRKTLGWDFPPHYTAKDLYRLLRNAVAHGGRLPASSKRIRHEIDKWSLFLMRRFLMRLGFMGEVASPQKGFASSSYVANFSEEHNNFEK